MTNGLLSSLPLATSRHLLRGGDVSSDPAGFSETEPPTRTWQQLLERKRYLTAQLRDCKRELHNVGNAKQVDSEQRRHALQLQAASLVLSGMTLAAAAERMNLTGACMKDYTARYCRRSNREAFIGGLDPEQKRFWKWSCPSLKWLREHKRFFHL